MCKKKKEKLKGDPRVRTFSFADKFKWYGNCFFAPSQHYSRRDLWTSVVLSWFLVNPGSGSLPHSFLLLLLCSLWGVWIVCTIFLFVFARPSTFPTFTCRFIIQKRACLSSLCLWKERKSIRGFSHGQLVTAPGLESFAHNDVWPEEFETFFLFLFNEVNELVRMSDCPTRGPFCFCADAAVSRRCFGVAEHLLSSLLHRRGRLLAVNLAPC